MSHSWNIKHKRYIDDLIELSFSQVSLGYVYTGLAEYLSGQILGRPRVNAA